MILLQFRTWWSLAAEVVIPVERGQSWQAPTSRLRERLLETPARLPTIAPQCNAYSFANFGPSSSCPPPSLRRFVIYFYFYFLYFPPHLIDVVFNVQCARESNCGTTTARRQKVLQRSERRPSLGFAWPLSCWRTARCIGGGGGGAGGTGGFRSSTLICDQIFSLPVICGGDQSSAETRFGVSEDG